jgi:hypothetical protein
VSGARSRSRSLKQVGARLCEPPVDESASGVPGGIVNVRSAGDEISTPSVSLTVVMESRICTAVAHVPAAKRTKRSMVDVALQYEDRHTVTTSGTRSALTRLVIQRTVSPTWAANREIRRAGDDDGPRQGTASST